MSFYEMDLATVFTSGRGVAGRTATAEAVAGRYLGALGDTLDPVKHPAVTAALERYYFAWQPQVTSVAVDIENLGNGSSSSAVAIADADADATTALGVPGAAAVAATGDLDGPVTAV